MKYLYEFYTCDPNLKIGRRYDTTTRPEEINASCFSNGNYVKVIDNTTFKTVKLLSSINDLDEWMNMEDHRTAIKSQHQDPIKQPNWDPFDEKETGIQMHKNISKDPNPIKPDQINPKHYQGFVEWEEAGWYPVSLQWIEVEFRKPYFRNNPDAIKGALWFQIDKYLGRLGQKDATVQELRKAKWYLEYLIAFESNGNIPLFVKDVSKLQE